MTVREHVRARAWAWKSVLLNALGSCLDYTLLMIGTKLLGLPTPIAAMLGVASGASFNFMMNRRFAFAATSAPIGPQALRYALAIGALMLVHAGALWGLRDGLGFPLLAGKLIADVGVLALSQPLVLRKFVFPATVTAS